MRGAPLCPRRGPGRRAVGPPWARWFFDYDDSDDVDDEPVHRLGEHRFAVGEYVTVTDEDGRPLTYKVVEVAPVAD